MAECHLAGPRRWRVQLGNDTYSAVGPAGRRRGGAAALPAHRLACSTPRWATATSSPGTCDDTPPFDAAGNYLGDTGVRQLEVAPGVLQDGLHPG